MAPGAGPVLFTGMDRYEPLRRIVVDELFTPVAAPAGPPRIGAELELIPLVADSGRPCPVFPSGGPATLPVLRSLARTSGWREDLSAKGTPVLQLPGGATLTYEPGGQLEVGSAPEQSASQLVRRLARIVSTLRGAMSAAGIDLVSAGIDPRNGTDATPLRFDVPRYRAMDDYFGTIGPAGRRMMRQTASLQVSVDLGGPAVAARRWRVLNAAAPHLTALFARSRTYGGADTGHASHRAWTWRSLDRARTGLPWADGAAAAARYTDFALRAPSVLSGPVNGFYRPFAFWWRRQAAGVDEWRAHLSTLFPEVRPRGYLEVRCMDTPPDEWLGVPIVLLAGLVYDEAALGEAEALLGEPDPDLLERAAAAGLADPRVGPEALALAAAALRGARRLGAPYVSTADADRAEEYLARAPARAREAA